MFHPLEPILRPRSIAVIGASRQPNSIGWQIVDNLLRYGYQVAVYPVNPKADAIHSIPAFPSVAAIGRPVDLAVITVPKEHVIAVARDKDRLDGVAKKIRDAGGQAAAEALDLADGANIERDGITGKLAELEKASAELAPAGARWSTTCSRAWAPRRASAPPWRLPARPAPSRRSPLPRPRTRRGRSSPTT